MCQMWESQAASRGQQSPQNLEPYQLEVVTNPFPQQGFFMLNLSHVKQPIPPNLPVLVTTRSS